MEIVSKWTQFSVCPYVLLLFIPSQIDVNFTLAFTPSILSSRITLWWKLSYILFTIYVAKWDMLSHLNVQVLKINSELFSLYFLPFVALAVNFVFLATPTISLSPRRPLCYHFVMCKNWVIDLFRGSHQAGGIFAKLETENIKYGFRINISAFARPYLSDILLACLSQDPWVTVLGLSHILNQSMQSLAHILHWHLYTNYN